MTKNKLVQPPLKWVGGKRQLISEIEKSLPNKWSTYYEPFVGGGAVLFHLQPKKAVINDVNDELINFYSTVKENVEELINELKKFKNKEDFFYEVRGWDRSPAYKDLSSIKKAARLHFLNKTCYNGLYRVNNAGEFNAPFGKYKNPDFVNESVLRAINIFLNKSNVRICNCDYQDALRGIRKGAFVYFDPPYDPVSSSASFTGYSQGGFDRNEQIRLKEICDKLNKKGVKFLLSNSATDFIKELYKEYDIKIVKARRSVNSVASKRGEVEEILVKNYD
ncbi:DNA adenine methylase [Proteinivorax tanatarense]|uniref:Site-specific DNA-methyltransferase (adenine-specific) n=1 Tax=Proteinivorax tanatarense TaxID=1260629 RepID=A0AAU7VM42_9FIRM